MSGRFRHTTSPDPSWANRHCGEMVHCRVLPLSDAIALAPGMASSSLVGTQNEGLVCSPDGTSRPSPKAGLRGTQAVLRHSLRREGPDSPRTVNAMVQVADQLNRQERYGEELLLREQVVETLRKNLGLDHENTLIVESQMGMCLLNLDREGDAEPLLVRVVSEAKNSTGSISPDAGEAMVGLAVIYMRLGRLDEARDLLERVPATLPNGRSYVNDYCFVYEVRSDKVWRIRGYMDTRGGWEQVFGEGEPVQLVEFVNE
jgi:hypothetical protein